MVETHVLNSVNYYYVTCKTKDESVIPFSTRLHFNNVLWINTCPKYLNVNKCPSVPSSQMTSSKRMTSRLLMAAWKIPTLDFPHQNHYKLKFSRLQHNVHSNNYFTSLEIHSMRWNHQKRRKIQGWNFSSSHQQTWRHTLWRRHLATRDKCPSVPSSQMTSSKRMTSRLLMAAWKIPTLDFPSFLVISSHGMNFCQSKVLEKVILPYNNLKNNQTLSNDWQTYCHTGI
jgi:hypothetical protein